MLTRNLAELEAVEVVLDRVIHQTGRWPDLCLLKTRIDLTFHRLGDVERDLALASNLAASAEGRALRADLDLQCDRFEDARKGYESAIQGNRTWLNLACLAYLEARLGNVGRADQLYVEAEDEITAKEMRSYSWVELRRGLLKFTHGDYDGAARHYQRAKEAYSGDVLADEHVAELLAARGRFDEAIRLYQTLIERSPRPELQHALGNLLRFVDKPDQAEPWYGRALEAYLASARVGQVHYYHHLSELYADGWHAGAEAVRWARLDLAVRRNSSTQAALAWGLYLDGRPADAVDAMQAALSFGVLDAELFDRAATICLAAGRTREGNNYLRTAAEINRHYKDFHVQH
jgi:predicted negative regulator of RcsB-dependent stress response